VLSNVEMKGLFSLSVCVSTNIINIYLESACNKHDSLLFYQALYHWLLKGSAALILIQQNKNAEAAGTMKENQLAP
jgi:hypothetical protein